MPNTFPCRTIVLKEPASGFHLKTMNRFLFPVLAGLVFVGMAFSLAQNEQRAWLAGDSHIHSHWSPGYDRSQNPPEPIFGGDGIYSTPTNAEKAKQYGLTWMVTTDHGGPIIQK